MDAYGTEGSASSDVSAYADPDGDPALQPASYPMKTTFSSEAGSVAKILKQPIISTTRNWNEEFQSLMERSYLDSEKDFQRTVRLRELCEEFTKLASRIGKLILSELYLDASQKSIPPITSSVGGVAGGDKYFFEGIFFKIPVDVFGIYSSEEGIMKSAGHELQGVMSILDCRIKGLHLPLMVLCDYRGHRILAASVLPLGKDTLCYGSSDGGRTIRASNEEMNAKTRILGKMLNLKEEVVSNTAKDSQTLLHISCDIEGHKGKDGRFYLVDTARVFPPLTPNPKEKGSFLVNLMRPEFLKNNPIPLCSDSFSGFGLANKHQHNQEIRQATHVLETVTIPNYARKLEENYAKFQEGWTCLEWIEFILADVHRSGINFRFLGLLRSHVTCQELRQFLLLEVLARVIKRDIRKEMRNLKTAEEEAYIKTITDFFNLFLGNPEFWRENLIPSIQSKYKSCLSEEEVSLDHGFILKSLDLYTLFLRIQTVLGIDFQVEIKLKFSENNFSPFSPSDIDQLRPVVKYIHRIFFEEGTALSKLAASKNSDVLFDQAVQKYKESIFHKPTDYRSFSNWGLTLFNLGMVKKSKGDVMAALTFLTDADQKFQSAIDIEPNDYKTLNKWANCLLEESSLFNLKDPEKSRNLLENACEKYRMASQHCGKDSEIFFNWGNALLKLSQNEMLTKEDEEKYLVSSCMQYQKAASLQNLNQIYRNWGVALGRRARKKAGKEAHQLFQEAYLKYQEAFKLDPNDHENHFNWANALYREAMLGRVENWAEASQHYSSSLKLKPNFYAAFNNWTKVLFKMVILKIPGIQQHLQEYVSLVESMSSIEHPIEFSPLADLLSLVPRDEITCHLEDIFSDLQIQDENLSAPQKRKKNDMDTVSTPRNEDSTEENDFLLSFMERISMFLRAKQSEDQQLSENDFELIKIIGGSNPAVSTTYKARRKGMGDIFAMKVIKKDHFQVENQLEFQLENQNPFLSKFLFKFQDEKRIYLAFEYVDGPTLSQLVSRETNFSEARSIFYAAEMILALEFLHSKNFNLINLNPEKILIDVDGHVTICQKIHLENVEGGFNLKTCQYLAPEILEGSEEGPAADWWSLGVIIYFMLLGRTPFQADKMDDIIEKILSADVNYPVYLSPQAKSLLQLLFEPDPEERLNSAGNIKNHPFFQNVEWSLMLGRKIEAPYRPEEDRMFGETAGNMRTVVVPNIPTDFSGFTYVSPSLEDLMKS